MSRGIHSSVKVYSVGAARNAQQLKQSSGAEDRRSRLPVHPIPLYVEDSAKNSPNPAQTELAAGPYRSVAITGNPKIKDISTSFVERQNLTMRMQMRRFTRLTNGFSKKIENHAHAVALHYMHYNFCRVHQTLLVTPAMEAGIVDHVWSLEEVLSTGQK